MLPVEAQCPSVLELGNSNMDLDIIHEVPSDALASQGSVGNGNLFACGDGFEVAGRENVKDADDASRISAGVSCAPLLASRGLQ